MEAELKAMEINHTWSIVPLPKGKNAVGVDIQNERQS